MLNRSIVDSLQQPHLPDHEITALLEAELRESRRLVILNLIS